MLKKFGRHSILLWMLLLCWAIPSKAQNAVKMIETDGTETIFLLIEQPKVWMADNSLIVETDSDKISCDIAGGIRFEFCNYESDSVEGIEQSTPAFKVTPQSVEAFNLDPLKTVAIYDISGKTVKTSQSDQNGYVYFSISELPAGVYIFNSPNKNFKFYKK